MDMLAVWEPRGVMEIILQQPVLKGELVVEVVSTMEQMLFIME